MLLITFHLIPELTIKAKIAYPSNKYSRNSTSLIQLAGIVIRSLFASIFDIQKGEYQICTQLLLFLHSKWYVSKRFLRDTS
jgi:hypothetical protein